tara:strand:- start:925 stop:1572 length:648 start_codon:yes stop_codon:yes gene_type:complete
MGLNISADGFEKEICPEGEYLGVCYSIVDLGTREEQWKDNPPKKRKTLRVTWELQDQLMTEGANAGKPFVLGRKYTASLNENATLYKDLVTWRGRPFSKEELDGFDVAKMVGAPATLHVEHNDNGNAVIKAIFKPDDFTTKETINEAVVFDLDVFCNEFDGNSNDETKAMCDVFDGLPEFIQNDINESFELLAAKKEESQQEDTSNDFADDEIPF